MIKCRPGAADFKKIISGVDIYLTTDLDFK